MILGVGIDIIEVERVRLAYERFGQRFLRRILRPAEINYCLQYANPAPIIAARFAAKEAVAKALGARIGHQIGWLDIEIVREQYGVPTIALHDKGQVLFHMRGAKKGYLSLTHSQNYAAAVAIYED